MDKHTTLKTYFGHSSFRPGQEGVIDSLLSGRDVMAVMPTGAGKSACYQIPALMGEGTTLVISPLISLMKDQVNTLCQSGVPAAYINSSLTAAQYDRVCNHMASGDYKLVYVAPERLDVPSFLSLCAQLKIPYIAVDEAHCVSQWGQDFRPGYLHIARFIEALPTRPVIGAFTATATDHVREDIVRLLGLRDPYSVTTGFDRPNLYFAVRHARPKQKGEVLEEFLSEHEGQSGIIYCSTRKGVEEVTADLCARGIPAVSYHAGMSDSDRRQNQEDFIFDRKTVMVATNAFGMGIDKSNVSYVVHYNMPKSMEAYYQEAGRAGRDGSSADCLLLYTPGDYQTARYMIENSGDENPDMLPEAAADHRARELERLAHMVTYATTPGCLRRTILGYFGESLPEIYRTGIDGNTCGRCSNCTGGLTTSDVTVESQMILSCIVRLDRDGRHYGQSIITQILRGAKSGRVMEWGLDRQSTYGLMKTYNLAYIKEIIRHLSEIDAIRIVGDDYPILCPGPAASEILQKRCSVEMVHRVDLEKEARTGKKARTESDRKDRTRAAGNTAAATSVDRELYRALSDLRYELASAQKIPPYYIFSNAALEDMCRQKPLTPEAFLAVSGVGEVKLKRYGEMFMGCIAYYLDHLQ